MLPLQPFASLAAKETQTTQMNPCACTNTHKRLLCSEKYIRNRLDK
jgi:hypothetical protein